MAKINVVAAIPAYNAAKTLPRLLDELIQQNYDEIFVLDDASSDATIKVAKSYGSKVRVIAGKQNVGSGANRNRIIGQTEPAIIHFIDADMLLLSKDTPNIIRKLEWPKDAAYIGGVVRNPDGTQNPFNYGPRPHILTGIFQGSLQFLVWQVGYINKKFAKFLRGLLAPLVRGLPNIYAVPQARRVHWIAESNMLVKSDQFAQYGGFDPRFRYSEIGDLALRVHRRNLHGYFTPEIDAVHASLDNVLRSGKKRYVAHKQFLEKHGKLSFYFPPLSDYLETRKTQKRYHR